MMVGRGDGKTKSSDPAEGEGFLGRWSRRKTEARTSDETPPNDPEGREGAVRSDQPPTADEPDKPAFDIKDLPDIDSLGPTSDFSVFMQAGVPAELKTKALRKLWRVKSELANLDGLIDYGEDLTGSFKVVNHLKTAYEVGRGFLRDERDDALSDDGEETASNAEDSTIKTSDEVEKSAKSAHEDTDPTEDGGDPVLKPS
jgi:hypothetical protein